MATKFNWTCPYCNREATINDQNYSRSSHAFDHGNIDGPTILATEIITCPSDECREYFIGASLHESVQNQNGYLVPKNGTQRLEWLMKPNSLAKQFPDYIPKAILNDYEEACLIKELSAKASATLSRRCLQGMIRDFFDATGRTLYDEINAIEDRVDPATWRSIDAVRGIGNIGAHMERDIDLIVDVEPEEAQLLIGLIEILIKDWYIARYEREQHLEAIVSVAKVKAAEKKGKSAIAAAVSPEDVGES